MEHLASNRKIPKFGSTPYAHRCIFGAKQSTSRGGSTWQTTANRIVLCWSGM